MRNTTVSRYCVLLLSLVLAFGSSTCRQHGRDEAWSRPAAAQASSGTEMPSALGPPDARIPLVRRIIVLTNDGGRVSWSGANNLIAFSRKGRDGYFSVHVMTPEATDERCLTCDKPGVPQLNNGQPTWHPSGKYIVFQCQSPELKLPLLVRSKASYLTQGGAGFNNNLWIMAADGSQFQQLTNIRGGEAILHPHFSHDGKRLFWAERMRDGEGRRARWTLRIADFVKGETGFRLENTKTLRPRGERDTFYESHGFSPDDKEIIFSASIGRTSPFDLDIWTMELESGKLTNLTHSPGVWDEHAHWAPSGNKIVWISSQGFAFEPSGSWGRTLKTEFWLMNPDGSDKTRITAFNEPGSAEYTGMRTICADNSWNRDGSRLVGLVTLLPQDGGRIFRDSILVFDGPQ